MSKSQSRKASVVRAVRLTPEQAAAIDAVAAARGIGPSSFAKEVLLRAARLPIPARKRRVDVQAAALAPLLLAINRVGVNLNQIAARANSGRDIDRAGVDQARHHLAAIHQELLRIGGGN